MDNIESKVLSASVDSTVTIYKADLQNNQAVL